MQSREIRRTFLDFFADREHRIWPSSSLIPNDPSLLLTVAGMVQFKPYFLGEATANHPRAASVQKSARTNDIENVGITTRHLTFFEMLGNFSFGDYFKREAIAWAWEISVSPPPHGFGFDPARIWATIFHEDDEAADLWLSETDVDPDHLQRRDQHLRLGKDRLTGNEDNFWSTGTSGPCGPCTELYYDRGSAHGPEGGPAADESRFMEYWNLVFMQYERDEPGNILHELPQRNVDTGMGLERMAVLLQDVPNVFETDVLRPMLDRAVDLTGVGYGDQQARDVSLRVIAEHARTASFLIADGVLPSNEARGYVLRRLVRRAVRHARTLGSDQPVMPAMTETVIATLGEAWPELRAQAELIKRVASAEEDGFVRTLRTGLSMLDETIAHAKAQGAAQLPGDAAFTLHDTYGFPVDLTVEIAAEHGLELDRDAFAEHMEAQRARARAAGGGGDGEATSPDVYRDAGARVGTVAFTGYTDEQADTSIGAIVTRGGVLEHAEEGDEVELVLPTTPFYAEGGGQLGDHGTVTTATGRLEVRDTVSPLTGLIVHRARVVAGEVHAGQDAHAVIDHARRASIRRGHTATHILHATLKSVVGEHAAQAGSAIDAGRFRFDFPHFERVTPDQVAELEERVNARISADPAVRTVETTQEEARRMGATALFGEKYGEHVRMVEIGDYSRELCGGTHVGHTAEVGMFTVLSEGSIAANLRRIEAVTGPEAFDYLSRERLVADEVARMLKVSTDEVVERVADLMERLRATEKEIARVREQALMASAGALLESAERIDGAGAQLVAATVEDADRDGLKALATDLRNRLDSGVVVLGSATPDGKAQLFAAVTADVAERVAARDVLAPGAKAVGGGAGGKGDTAQAGGRDGSKLAEAIEASRRAARDLLRG